uniref:Uncharacterized protein n=1 Tax=Meloidogyne hapla TaxID=6305 RepID=A0A1I8BH05_MELHA
MELIVDKTNFGKKELKNLTEEIKKSYENIEKQAKKFNYYNENYENKLKGLINYLECFDQIFDDLNIFGINFKNKKIKEFLIKYGNELIKEFIKNKIEIEIINVSIEESKNYTVDVKDIKNVENWLEKKMDELNKLKKEN